MELDTKCYKALELLYQSQDGAPFEELNIDDSTFLLLHKHDYLSEPEGDFFDTGFGMMCVHKGLVQIEPMGRAYVENTKMRKKREVRDSRRYWITTGIAIAALITAIVSIVLQYL